MTPKQYPQNVHTPKNIHFQTPKNIEIQKFDSKKMDRAYVCMKISKYHPPRGLLRSFMILVLYPEEEEEANRQMQLTLSQ